MFSYLSNLESLFVIKNSNNLNSRSSAKLVMPKATCSIDGVRELITFGILRYPYCVGVQVEPPFCLVLSVISRLSR